MPDFLSPDDAERFVQNYADLILRLCRTHGLSKPDAQDICQTLFLRMLERRTQFTDYEHEKAFLIRATVNECRNLLRRGKRTVSLEAAVTQAAPESQADSEVLAAVQALPRKYRDAVFLHYFEGYDTTELAVLTGCSPAAARKRLSRARALLKTDLEGFYEPIY